MSTQIRRRRGTTANHSTFTGAGAEITVDTDKNVPVVHDGATAGGFPGAREDLSNVARSNVRLRGESPIEIKSANYTALAADRGKTLVFDGAYTLALTAAATLTNGWLLTVLARGGNVTIDPDAAELIEGAATLVIPDGAEAIIRCDGTEFRASVATLAHCFLANKNGVDQTGIAVDVFTKLTFGTEEYDIGSHYDAANSRWTPPAGKYHIGTSVIVNSVNLSDQLNMQLHIYKNGALYQRHALRTSGSSSFSMAANCSTAANGTDYFEVFFITTGGTGDKEISGFYAAFSGHRVA